jgi:transposase InsO family protein
VIFEIAPPVYTVRVTASRNKRYCYPLTVTDHSSRYLLLCEAMESNQEQFAFTAFERLFKERGLPQAIRSDNGVPFASPNGRVQPLQALSLVAAPGH